MNTEKNMQHLSMLTSGWSYIPAGLTFGYLLVLPLQSHVTFGTIFRETQFWPYIVAIITLIISVALTNGLKLNHRKCQFVHLYIQLAAMVFYLVAGLIFLLVEDVIPAIYLAACGLGLTLIPGLSYIHIRAPGRWRSIFMGLCYFWFLVGLASTATILFYQVGQWNYDAWVVSTVHTNVAICLLATASFMIVMVGVNEMLQREAIVDYKKPLDFDTDIAHESGKLMDRRERRNLYSNFTNPTLAAPNGAGTKQWNTSTEQIILGRSSADKNYHRWWVFLMIFTKLQGFIAFYYVFVAFAVTYTIVMFQDQSSGYSVFWFMVFGSLLGILLMFFMSNKFIFLIASVLHTIGLILAVSFYTTSAGSVQMGASLIIFYTFIGTSLVIPAINILELAPLNFNESFLAIGSILELIGIALMQYFVITDVSVIGIDPNLGYPKPNYREIIAGHFIAMILLSVILQVIVLWHMPNTYKKSLAEIHSDLARMTSYFAFGRMTAPPNNHRSTITRAFAESVSSEQPEIEEKQTGTRNGQAAVRYNDRNDEGSPRRSPPNEFSENRYNRRAVVERERSPTPDREDPYLQERLQRQHERNYVLSRQQHYHQRARDSPEPQQQIRHMPEREPDNVHPHRYSHEPEPYAHDRPHSSNSQPTRYTQPPQLLARQQYYEEYSEYRQQQPRRSTPPIRQSPIPPQVEQLPPPPIIRRPQTQTVKSEPGYVSRPRLQTQKSDAPAPPPMPPADYLTKSLPRINPEQKARPGIHPVLVPKPEKPKEEIVPGVEYSHNLLPSEFLRQSRDSMFARNSSAVATMS
ncbi:uncharacterized protein LOC129766092 [Toxorhynchites rutilus septentrionalis]|uniref:uncharacterized protein LOC129766092 n=1 Tax=Toxorhynchites rutilus septentrionalis TaxID=329112 RepID=UPI00247A2D4A|nr:uncharacterized protein LOC129766092 [Toxorhynchites rutilus septentrionalis]